MPTNATTVLDGSKARKTKRFYLFFRQHSRPNSTPNLQARDQVGEGLKKSPKVAAKLNELPFSSLSLSTGK